MAMRSVYTVGTAHAGEGDVVCLPRLYKADGTKMGVIFCHNLGGVAISPVLDPAQTNFHRILQAIVDTAGFPVVATDLGGAALWNNDTVMTRIGEAKTLLQQIPGSGNGFVGGGAKAGKVALWGYSMGGASSVRYAYLNPGNVACLLGLLPGCDLNDLRNFNRPNGWTGTVQNVPQNGNGINLAWGLASDSTSDYPTHGTSLVALPATANPATSYPTGIPAKAWYSTDDTSVIPATCVALWQTAMGGTVVPTTGVHGDAGLASVNATEVAQFLVANQT